MDWRHISNGQKIFKHGYCDQPYIVTTKDGTWVCTFTTSPGHEGENLQYIASTYSFDQGRTWSAPVEIESPSQGKEASWAMPLVTKFDRIYVFYTYNGDGIRHLPDGTAIRADTHGWYCYRYSDDKGKTWSKRFRLKMRKTACDRNNDFKGEVQMFWGIGKPVSKDNNVWFSFTKLGKYFLEKSEGWIYYSDNILTERDVSKINWQLLPEGDIGIKSPELGSVQEEFNFQPMNIENGLYCIYRTTLGQPAHSYSYDNGKTWSEPELLNYANGMPLRNPRACPRLWKCKNGKYLLWYHNNGGNDFSHRNPAWVSGGIEKNGKIYWSQPEILIHGPDRSYTTGRFSYPDLVEEEGKYWISTTQKTTATIHEVPAEFFEMLWGQFNEPKTTSSRPYKSVEILSITKDLRLSEPIEMNSNGFAMDFWLKIDAFRDTLLFEGALSAETKMNLHLMRNGLLQFVIKNKLGTMRLTSDAHRFEKGKTHHVAIILDSNAKICYMLIDGNICDGGGSKTFGFSWLGDELLGEEIQSLAIKERFGGIKRLRFYFDRMFTSDFVDVYHAEK